MSRAFAGMEQLRGCSFCAGALTGVPAARNGAGPARVLLPANALSAAGLSSGELVLLAVVQLPDEDSAPTPPGSTRGRQSSAMPPRTPPSGSRGNARPALNDDAEAVPLVLARRGRLGDGGACAAEGGPQAPGDRLLAVCVWPSQQLAAGAASASPAVLEAAFWPAAGTSLRVYPLAAQGAQQRVRARVTEAATLALTLCEASGADTSPLPDAVPGSPLTPQSSHGAGASRASPSPALKASAAKSSAVSDTQWLNRVIAEASSATLAFLGSFAARCLEGRTLLVGNQVMVPLLGRTVRCRVSSAAGVSDAAEASDSLSLYTVSSRTTVTLQAAGASADAGADTEPPPAAGPKTPEETVCKVASVPAARNPARFAALGGVEDAIAALRRLVVLPLRRPEMFAAAGLRPPRGVLLHGPPGTGKTHLARAVAAEAGATLFVVSGPELVSEFIGESETHLRDVFAAAAAAAPSVVFLDELDAIAPARGDAGRSSNADSGGMSARIVTTLLTLLDGASDALAGVAVVAATNRPDAIDAALRRPGRFDAEVLVGIPSAKGRVAILESHLATVRHDIGPPELADVAARLHGFTGADIGALIGEASLTALRRAVRNGASGADDPSLRVSAEDLAAALRVIRPSGLRSFSVEAPPAAAWDDVAGLDDVKQRLREVVEWPEARSSELARIGAAPPRGVLLYGPPGCAKTSLARAVAARSGRNFIAASGPDIYSLWVGESEKAIASLFERARSAAPCVLFLDELDALAPAREAGDASGGGGSRVTERVLAQLLTELDGGAGGLPGSAGVALLAATNRPDRVDPALLRPGRLDRLLYVPPPADAAERTAVLAVHCRNTPLAPDVDLAALGRDTEGFTGAGLSAMCREAALAALEEDLSVAAVAARHFAAARLLVSPSPPLDAEVSAMYARLARG